MTAHYNVRKSPERRARYIIDVAQAEKLFPCERGHVECAAWTNGPCIEDIMAEEEEVE